MAVGKPIIASDIDGYANVLNHGEEGILVPPKDVDKLTQNIISLLTNSGPKSLASVAAT